MRLSSLWATVLPTALRTVVLTLAIAPMLPSVAAEPCVDVYEAKLGVRPAGEKYWFSPDRDFKLSLPATHSAKAGTLEILVSVKRRDSKYLVAEFTLITKDKREAFLAQIQMDQETPKPFAESIVSTTGSEFSLALIPICTNT